IPIDFNWRTISDKLHLLISGGVKVSKLLKIDSGYNRKHLPGHSRPALPFLCDAEAFEIGTTFRASIPFKGLKALIFTNPVSMTYLIPCMVIDVSAIFVAKTTFLHPSGVF